MTVFVLRNGPGFVASALGAIILPPHRYEGMTVFVCLCWHGFSFFRHWSHCADILVCGIPQQAAVATRPRPGLVQCPVLDIHAPASYHRCGNLPDLGQDCWLVTCQDWWTGVSHRSIDPLLRERDVLAHCSAGWQTRLHQCCASLAAASASATSLSSTVLFADFSPVSTKTRLVAYNRVSIPQPRRYPQTTVLLRVERVCKWCTRSHFVNS